MNYPMWHINWGNHDTTDTRLDSMLTVLFVDSWTRADSAEHFDQLPVGGEWYDLFVIFHAGAGNEFDIGFDFTPHDIPSVFIDSVDLATWAGLTDGIPLSNGETIKRGVILPEMQRQVNVDIGMLGTTCAQIGHLIGMPHLYQPETGTPAIGLFGLMDRGSVPISGSCRLLQAVGCGFSWDGRKRKKLRRVRSNSAPCN